MWNIIYISCPNIPFLVGPRTFQSLLIFSRKRRKRSKQMLVKRWQKEDLFSNPVSTFFSLYFFFFFNVQKRWKGCQSYIHVSFFFIFPPNNHLFIYFLFFCIYVLLSISFLTFLVQEFKIVVDSWKFSILLLYILWNDWPIFMISGLNEQLQQQLEYTLVKPDCHSWWISKMQSGHEDRMICNKIVF